jgi:hypothetical protein
MRQDDQDDPSSGHIWAANRSPRFDELAEEYRDATIGIPGNSRLGNPPTKLGKSWENLVEIPI